MKRILCLFVIAVITSIGCNLATNATVFPTPTPQIFVSATPRPFPPTITPLSGIILATPPPNVFVPTPLPGTIPAVSVPADAQNAVEWMIAQVVIPVWNFLYTLVINGAVTLWAFAGDRGGLTAQVCGCLLPTVVGGFFILRTSMRRIRLI